MTNSPDGAVEDWANFALRVETVLQLQGAVGDVPSTWAADITSAVAALTGGELSARMPHIASPCSRIHTCNPVQSGASMCEPGLPSTTTHLWILVKGLDANNEVGGMPQEQQVLANMTAAMGDPASAE
eukprot:4119558-Prymnesium_polylepis.1